MREKITSPPFNLLFGWSLNVYHQGILHRMNKLLLSLLLTLIVADHGFAQLISPTYSSANAAKASAQSTLGKPLCPNTLDIVIAIDSSESVQGVWNSIIDDAQSFIRNFQVADHLTRIGIVDFSAVANVYSPLDSNNTVESANRVLETLRSRPQNGETWVELGLDRASEVFDTATPPRLQARKVLVMYTDGETTSRDYNSLKDLVKHEREQDIETFVVTVTNTSYQPGLQIMASSFAHIYHMGKQVQIGQPTLSEGVCWGVHIPSGPSLNFVDPAQTQNISPDKSKCEREREGALLVIQSKVPTLVPIFVPECEPNGKYKVIQRHEGTGFYWCVHPDTGDIINGTRTVNELPNCPKDLSQPGNGSSMSGAIEFDNNKNNTRLKAPTPTPQVTPFKNLSEARKQGEPIIKYIPPIVLSKCQEEEETANQILTKKTPSSVPVLVPDCEPNGNYKKVQTDGSDYYWCVDPKRGEIINGTRTYKEKPVCSENDTPKRPLTNCEQERDENMKKQSTIPDIHIPECSVFDGLYLEIQRIWVGAKFCVNRYTGDHIKGTDTEIGKPDPICPEMTKCEKMQVEIHTHNYRNLTRPAILRRDVPICKRNGFFDEVQSSLAIGKYWCVNKITGAYIDGTITYDKKPECPGASNNAMSSYISSLAEGSQPGFLSSFYNSTQPTNTTGSGYTLLPANVSNELEMKPAQIPSQPGRVAPVVRISSTAGRPLTNCQRQQIEKLKIKNITQDLHILQCSDFDGLYAEIQTSPQTGRKYCVTRYTGDYIKGTEVPPGPVNPKCPIKSKCDHEREKVHTYNYRNFGLAGYNDRTILHCNQNGFYKLLQSDSRTRVNWCVDELTGEYISPSVMHFPRVPDCSKVSPPHTKCEREKAQNGRKQLVSPDTFVPRCNVFNGLYADIQYMPSGWKWCVDKFNGERIGSTDTEPGPQEPLCPELSNCEREKVEAHTYNYRNYSNSNFVERFVPHCDPNGLYASIQTNKNLSMWWCADKITGEPINGTTKYSWQGKPVCSDAIPALCLLPKAPGPCKNSEPRTFFDTETATCETFIYGGCGGNENNFESLQECETKCGSVTKCFIQREKSVGKTDAYIPLCMVDGSYQQLQHHPNGSSWCVDTETGFTIPGTITSAGNADCSRVPVIVEPKREPTCSEDNERIFGKRPYPIVGVYVPQCTADGFYAEIQKYGSTGEIWCVHQYTGIQIEGTLTKIGGRLPNCPKHPNVDCLLPREPGGCKGLFPRYYYDWQKNRCVRFNYGGCQGNANNFKNFRLCERSCKDPFKTNHPLDGNAAVQAEPSRERMIVEANPLTGPVPLKENAPSDIAIAPSNASSVSQLNASVKAPVTSSVSPVNTSTPMTVSIAPANASSVALSNSSDATPMSASVAKPADEPVIPANASAVISHAVSTLFAPSKNTSDRDAQVLAIPLTKNESSVISPQALDVNTPVIPISGAAVPLKDLLTGKYEASSPVKAFFANTSNTYLAEQAPVKPGYSSIYSDPPYMPKSSCALELDYAKSERIYYKDIGSFLPSCDQQGSYMPMQKNESSGERWCVEVATGYEIVPTRRKKSEQDPDCGNLPKSASVAQNTSQVPTGSPISDDGNKTTPLDKMPIGVPAIMHFPIPEPEPSPTKKVKPPKINEWLVPPENDTDIYHPKNPCSIEYDFAKTKNDYYRTNYTFLPQCDDKGFYKPLQTQGTEGNKWCVDIVTGQEIVDTRVGVDGPDPDCPNDVKSTTDAAVAPVVAPANATVSPANSTVAPANATVAPANATVAPANATEAPANAALAPAAAAVAPVAAGIAPPAAAVAPAAAAVAPPAAVVAPAAAAVAPSAEAVAPAAAAGAPAAVTVAPAAVAVAPAAVAVAPSTWAVAPAAAAVAQQPSVAAVAGESLQRHEIAANGTGPNVLSEKETAPQQGDINQKNSIAPLQNVIPIEHVIAPLNETTGNNTVLNRNQIVNESTAVQSDSASTTGVAEPSPVKNDSAIAGNASHVANLTNEAKEGMKDLGEAIGSLFGGLFSAMMPIVNATTNSNTSNLSTNGSNPSSPSPVNGTEDSSALYMQKERSELNEFAFHCPYEIGINLTKMGCVNDDGQVPRPLPVRLFNDSREEDIPDWRSVVRSIVCKCAIETRKKGWYTFGIQDKYECYSGPDEGRWNEDGEASKDMCVDEENKQCEINDTQACAGIKKTDDKGSSKEKHANYVYMIVTDTHKQINIIHYDRRKRKRSLSNRLQSRSHKRRYRNHRTN